MNWLELDEIRRKADAGELTVKQAGEYIGIILHVIRVFHYSLNDKEIERILDVAGSLHRAGATIPADTTTEAFIKNAQKKLVS